MSVKRSGSNPLNTLSWHFFFLWIKLPHWKTNTENRECQKRETVTTKSNHKNLKCAVSQLKDIYSADTTASFHHRNHTGEHKEKTLHHQQDHLRPARRSGKNSDLPCLYGVGARHWHRWCWVCRVLVFPQWTETDVSRDTCSGSASSSSSSSAACLPAPRVRGRHSVPKTHPSLSPLACYCLKHCRRFLNSLRCFRTMFLILCLIIKCREWRSHSWLELISNDGVIIGASISLWLLWWKDLN